MTQATHEMMPLPTPTEVRRWTSSCLGALRRRLSRQKARRVLARCQAIDPRFARDIGMSDLALHWECGRGAGRHLERR